MLSRQVASLVKRDQWGQHRRERMTYTRWVGKILVMVARNVVVSDYFDQ